MKLVPGTQIDCEKIDVVTLPDAPQLALQQQQQHLQQQLQNFLLLQPGTAQASAVLLHSQVQQAVTQATNQLRLLQRQREIEKSKQQLLQDTPKSNPRPSPPFQETLMSKINKTSEQPPRKRSSEAMSPMNRSSSASPPLKISLKHLTPVTFSLPPTKPEGPSATTNAPCPAPPSAVTNSLPRPPTIPDPQIMVPRLDLPADENVDLEELEQFAKDFKQRRIKLGK